MKKQKDYSWLLLAIILGLAVVGSMGCKGNRKIDHKDSTEYAVFDGWQVEHGKDFETEAVFIPVSELSMYDSGSTVWIDENGFIAMPIRDAETNQFVTDGLQKVELHERVLPNKFIPLK